MREHDWHDEPISVKLFFLVLLPKEGSGDVGVCVSMKANKDESLHLIIKSEVMIALREDVSQMCY